MKRKLVLFFLCCVPVVLFAQRQKADSLVKLLNLEKTDTIKARLMWEISGQMNAYDPTTAMSFAQKSFTLSNAISFQEGKSKALGAMASTSTIMGNYPKALELNLQKIKLEEEGNNPRNLAFALMNTGIVYRYQEEYAEALKYYYRSDSVINENNVEYARYFIYMNLGDVYDRLNNTDSAFNYFNKALTVANNKKDDDYIGNAMTGLGHTYFKQANANFSFLYYQTAIKHLQAANDDDVLCEAMLGMANLYQQLLHKNDSAVYYANSALQIAQKGGFLTKQLDAVNFLANHYKTDGSIDSAYVYLQKRVQLNDSINSKDKIRSLQMMSSNENIRQQEIEESKRLAKKERKQQLQLLFIGIFIPGFFLLTLLLSRISIPTRVIKILGIISLLILFEYLTLFLHPTVASITNHTPIYEMLIFVTIAAILIPAHHRIESWLIKKLTQKNEPIKLKRVKVKFKVPPNEPLS